MTYVGVEQLVKNRGGVSFSDSLPDATSGIEYLPGDVLIGNIRPYLKKIWLADRCGGASGDVVVIRIKDSFAGKIDSAYLYKALSSDAFFAYDNLNTKGAKMPRGDRESISRYLVPIPSISEQKRIVEETGLLVKIIDAKQQQLRDFDSLTRSLFYETFGDPSENLENWPVVSLDSIANCSIGLTYKPDNVCEDGTIVLRSSNIQENEIDLTDIVRVNSAIKEHLYVRKGDILMCSRNGSFKLLGKVARIESLPERMTYGAFMTVIRSEYSPYLFEFFKLPAFREQLGLAKTATINQITVNMLAGTKIPLPPKELQDCFANRVSVIYEQKKILKESIKDCQQLLDSRMSHYFD